MFKVGLRVVRGKDWNLGNEDSGEGHLGTVIRLGTPKSKRVTVCWDNGNITEHRAGLEDAFNLRVFDNAPVVQGVRHPGVSCDGCDEKPITGFRFKCIVCQNIDFCTHCYMNEKSHDPTHVFGRFDAGQDLEGCVLPPRSRRSKTGVFGKIRRFVSTSKSFRGHRFGPRHCNGCDDEITGYRLKCLNCPDFDFCAFCYIKENSHDPTHVFGRFESRKDFTACILRLRTPSGKVGRRDCVGCDDEIDGLRYMCLDCPGFDFCTHCYQNKTHNLQHTFAKFHLSEDYIANKLPLRVESRKVTSKGIFKDAIVVRGKDWPYGDKYGKENCEGVVLGINSCHRGYADVSFPGSVETNPFKLGLNGSVEIKFVNSSSNGTYYPDHLPPLKFKLDHTMDETSKSESSLKSESDDFDPFLLSHVDENQNARDNAHLDFVSMMYKDKMEKVLANPRSIPEEELHDHHQKAIEFCLEAVSKVKPLTDAIIRKVNGEIGSVYEEYKGINSKKKTSTAPAIGIDLGTTYCCVAVFRNQEVEVIPNLIGGNATLSHVAFSEDDIIVGETAKEKAYLNPQDTIYDVKRMCGRHFDEEKIQRLRKYWPFTIVKGEDGKIQIKVQNKYLLPEQVITEILINLKESADIFLGDSVINAVITVPAYFSPRQKALTKEACYKAGLNVLQFISEPTAAAVAYGLHLQHEKDKRNCLIFDLGGGTFDVAVLELHKNQIKIKAIDGDSYLGGEDFDNVMIEYCVKAFEQEHGIDLMTVGSKFERYKRLKRIKTECETQKRYLSATTKVKVSMDNIHGQIPLVVPFTRDIFSDLIKPSVDKCVEVVDQILNKCEMKETDIDDVMVVGGSSRIPYVQSRLLEKFGGKPLLKRIKPEEVVAHGAAIMAFNIENPHACLPNVFILDSNFRSVLDVS